MMAKIKLALFLQATKATFLLALLVCFSLTSGCGGGSGDNPTPQQVKARFMPRSPKTRDSKNAPSIPSTIEIYIDGSSSMKGFLKTKSNEASTTKNDYIVGQNIYSKSLTNLRATLSSLGSSSKFFEFGADIKGNATVVNNPDQASNDINFYDQGDTLIGPIIQRLAERSKEQASEAFIIITDGVQSSPTGSNFTDAVDGVAKWLGNGGSFEILAFNSMFYCDAFSAIRRLNNQPEKIGTYSGNRPFYWYVFSTKPNAGKTLKELLITRFNINSEDIKYFNFSSGLTETSKVSLDAPARISNNNSNPLQIKSKSPEADLIYLRWTGNNEGKLAGQINAKFDLKINEDFKNLPIDFKNLTPRAVCQSAQGESSGIKESNSPEVSLINSQVTKNPDSVSLECAISIDKIDAPGWQACRVELLPKDTILPTPQWVEDWSIDNDSSIANYSRTLFFREFVASIMLKAKFKEQPIADFYAVFLGRKK